MGNYFDDVTLTFTVAPDEADVSCDITAATLTPDTTEEIRKRLCGQRTVTGKTTWSLELEWDQNWSPPSVGPPEVVAGLSWFLQEHDGESATFVIDWPLEDTRATGTVRIKPGPFGGTAGEIAEATITLGLDGEPTYTSPIPATAAALDAGDTDAAEGQAAEDVDVDETVYEGAPA